VDVCIVPDAETTLWNILHWPKYPDAMQGIEHRYGEIPFPDREPSGVFARLLPL
jgi:hypothetical protein